MRLYAQVMIPLETPTPDCYRVVRNGEYIKLDRRPERLRVVVTLEFPVKDSEGTYLLVMHPNYTVADAVENGNGLALPPEPGEWTPPYISYDPDGSRFSRFPKETGKLFSRFDVVDDETIERDLHRYAERLGLGFAEFEPLDDFYEFRRSFSSPGSFRGYHIRRFLFQVEEDDMDNVADQEMRKGFAFLPIDERFHDLKSRQCARHHRPEKLFMGMPVVSNLRTVLEDQGPRETLCSMAVEIGAPSFATSYEGFVFAGDLAGYGKFCQFLTEHTGDLNTPGEAGAQEFRDLAIRQFTKLFHSSDMRHVHTAGDGFICALPASELPSAGEAQLRQALSAYLEMTKRLDEINELAARLAEQRGIESPPPRLGSRLAIHHGSYRFGKMSLLASLLPTLDGASVIEAARIEAGLRNWIYGNEEADRHWLAVSGEAVTALDALDVSDLTDYGPFESKHGVDVAEKEFAGAIGVWQVAQ